MIPGIFKIVGNDVRFLEFWEFLEMTSNFRNFPLFINKSLFIYIFNVYLQKFSKISDWKIEISFCL